MASPWRIRSFASPLLICIAVVLITYNAILFSTNARLHSDLSTSSLHFHRTLSVSHSHKPRLFHTAVTASDSVYNTWQCRVMYYWFKKARETRVGSDMGGFTRILHSGKPDSFMGEIPTFVAQPLPDGTDQGYIVLNRPWAFVQWLQKANIPEEYILMAEPDHIIVKPIPNLSVDGQAAAFPFFYIEPQKYEPVLRKFFPEDRGPINTIDPIGNSPVIIEKKSLGKIAPTWMNISLAMKKDTDADKSFGWVLEMYAYAVASALHGVRSILHKNFMIQPPWDLEVGDKFIIHYTYGCDYTMEGKLTYGKIGEWRFDKRSYDNSPPPRNLPLPPKSVPESVVTLVTMVNEATANIPNWESSW
ncbi:Hyp O-arabinosyltransferase-like protein [Rhynchospora pubera]|uniref:Hyp O-arabinosyltransferase-like protein n=1 Tax=Rhynchospora pubera TaxID=906938 RepID=A0AAV8FGM4_9POAL|nr:Hyp O-arabinosyltransferase-like protein [Rhynchospora pubera]